MHIIHKAMTHINAPLRHRQYPIVRPDVRALIVIVQPEGRIVPCGDWVGVDQELEAASTDVVVRTDTAAFAERAGRRRGDGHDVREDHRCTVGGGEDGDDCISLG